MNKVLEALNDLGSRLASVDTSRTIEEAHYDVFPVIREALTELEALKRYPTSEEVCEALSEYIKRPIEYYAVAKQFLIRCSNGYHEIARLHGNGEISFDITYCLPPHLITLIGRFYEGLEKVGAKDV